jgi:hypothetical protein
MAGILTAIWVMLIDVLFFWQRVRAQSVVTLQAANSLAAEIHKLVD